MFDCVGTQVKVMHIVKCYPLKQFNKHSMSVFETLSERPLLTEC